MIEEYLEEDIILTAFNNDGDIMNEELTLNQNNDNLCTSGFTDVEMAILNEEYIESTSDDIISSQILHISDNHNSSIDMVINILLLPHLCKK